MTILVGRGASDGGFVNVGFNDCALCPDYTLAVMFVLAPLQRLLGGRRRGGTGHSAYSDYDSGNDGGGDSGGDE